MNPICQESSPLIMHLRVNQAPASIGGCRVPIPCPAPAPMLQRTAGTSPPPKQQLHVGVPSTGLAQSLHPRRDAEATSAPTQGQSQLLGPTGIQRVAPGWEPWARAWLRTLPAQPGMSAGSWMLEQLCNPSKEHKCQIP